MTKENYQNLYDSLMLHRKSCLIITNKNDPKYIYHEDHHIIPKSFGGKNNKDNIVSLYGWEHFLAHKLLMYIHQNDSLAEVAKDAFWRMCYCHKDQQYHLDKTSKQFQKDRELALQIDKQKMMGRIKINKDDTEKFIKKSQLDLYLQNGWKIGALPLSKEHREKLSISGKGKRHIWKKKLSSEVILRRSLKIKGKPNLKARNKMFITNGLIEIKINKNDPIPEGFYKGRKQSIRLRMLGKKRPNIFSDDVKKQISEKNKGKIPANKNKIGITNGVKNTFININEPIPKGWYIGGKKRGKYKTHGKYVKSGKYKNKNKKQTK